jgi:hypothetical protein
MKKIIFLLVFCSLFGCSGSVTEVIPPDTSGTLSPANIPNQKEIEESLLSTPQDTGQDRQKTAEFFKTEISDKATKQVTVNPKSENDKFQNECESDYIQGHFSPDENWYVCQTPYDIYLKNMDGKEVVFEPPGINKNDQIYWFSPILWSSDSRFIWVGAGETGGFAEYCDPAQPYLGLFRIDTTTGMTSATLPLSKNSYYFEFSPSGRYLGYIQGRTKLTVLDIITGNKWEYAEPQELSGAMLFSPDESKMAFSTQETSSDVNCRKATLKILDNSTGVVETYYRDPENAPITFSFWDESGLIGFDIYPDKSAIIDFHNRTVTITQP